MATITELVEREAAAAEAETPDDEEEAETTETPHEPHPEPEPEAPAEPMSEKDWEALSRKMDAESQRHEKRVREIFGAQFAEWHECPLCPVPGYVTRQPPPEFDPMQRVAVLTAMGDEAQPVYRAHANWYRCTTCDGWGEVATGSRRQGADHDGCPDCGGKGYRRKDFDAVALPTSYAQPQPTQPQPTQTFNTVGPADAWGRPQGHPHYGIEPQYAGIGG